MYHILETNNTIKFKKIISISVFQNIEKDENISNSFYRTITSLQPELN